MEVIAASLCDAVVSAVFHSLFDLTSSAHFIKFARKEKIMSELKKWEDLLLSIKASLEDAEEKQTTCRSVKLWLSDLRDIAYDAEDIIDELATEAQRRQMKEVAEPPSSPSLKVIRSYLSSCCLRCNPSTVKFSNNIESKIKKLTARLEEAVSIKNDLSLVKNERGRYERMRERLRTSSLVDESRVYGREKDKEAILDLLMNYSNHGGISDIGVVSIVGMGGVGKTTLAQVVYNDVKVENFFDLRVWVCVSEEFDVVRMTTTVLQAVTLESCNLEDLNLLQVTLKEKLSGKKFFIVLDDVWNENYEQWEILCRPFTAGAAGSKILVTTRNEGIASMVATCGAYRLKELADDDCLTLFTRHALGTSDFEGHPNLKLIGVEIVRKCKGLPLAAKTLGGLLRNKGNCDEWENILRSKIWDLSEERSGILPALRLSYHHLPFHLKRCFSYCAIFPKGFEFDKDELVLLWMAEGLLHQIEGKKQMKDIGVEYFHDLWSRSFFQQSASNKMRYVMHDLINELAQFVSREICFNFDGDKSYARVEKVRHFSFVRHQYDTSKRFEILNEMKKLRTFIASPIHALPWTANSYLSKNVLHELLPRLICLRVLSLSGYCIDELPHNIGCLMHLRYFNLSQTRIKALPDSVGSLFNLQTLILNGCKNLIKLPQAIENLINLQVLDLTDTDNLTWMPMLMGNLKNLHILSKFIVQRNVGPCITELKGLSNLRKELCILGLENVADIQVARGYILKDKQGLEGLELRWSNEFLGHGNGEDDMVVSLFNMLQPHENLKKLRIVFYGGRKFPSWLGGSSWANIVEISLSNCRNIMSLPALGRFPSLKKLSIEGMDEVKELDSEFFGGSSTFFKPFPVLEVLQIQNMLKWENWNYPCKPDKEGKQLPSLREFMILGCPVLHQKLPSYLPSLVKLIIRGCPNVAYSPMSLPSLLDLNIEDSNIMVLRSMGDLTSLAALRIRSLSGLTCLLDEFEQFPGALKHLLLSNCTGLTSLWQKSTEFENAVPMVPTKINGSSQLLSLAGNEQGLVHNGLHCLRSLEHLHIESCPILVSFSETGFLSMLRRLRIKACPMLKNLPNWMMRRGESTGCLLEDLEIEECPSLTEFPCGSLPSTLKRLKIQGCNRLHSLPDGLMHAAKTVNTSQLENLEIIGCPSLLKFPEGKLPFSLKKLKIWDCLLLEPLSDKMLLDNASLEYIGMWNCSRLEFLPESLCSFTCLVELNISNCRNLKCFPETGLLLPNLRTLDISTCVNLGSLPEMLNLTSLQNLTICDCPHLVSFPRGGLPPNLLSLEIWDCKEFKEPMSKWNLHALTSLRDFSIAGGPEMVCFPEENCLLPTTLVSIFIARIHNLESLSMGIQNLSSLEELEVVECPNLQRLPRGGLPATLGRLCIRNCSLLKDQCSREKGEYWPVIGHIPCVEIETADI